MKKNPYKVILKMTNIIHHVLNNIHHYNIEKIKEYIQYVDDLKIASQEIMTELELFKPEEIDELEDKKNILEQIEILDKLVIRINRIPSFW